MSVPHHPAISVPRGRNNTSYGDLDLTTQLVSSGTWMYIFKFGDVDDTPKQVGGPAVHFTLNCNRSDMFAIDHCRYKNMSKLQHCVDFARLALY
jgi:hypothetical protein